ncbi:YesL family protein [Gracilibacillus xinjiangensis]|uniref:YesL family protein n=1 Tax=Gracilibacillus xinjiangensis TaxID=1193282 RepID=A0ABV8WXA8_9BACI
MDTNWAGSIMQMLDKAVKLVWMNCLWVIFTLIGGIVLGVMPATASVSFLVRKMIKNEEIENVFQEFWKYYKNSFKSSNIIGLSFWVVGLFLFVDITFLIQMEGMIAKVLLIGVFVLLFVFLGVLLNFFPIYSRFEMKIMEYIKLAFVMAMTRPVTTVFMVLWLCVVTILSIEFSVIIPLLFNVLIILGINWLSIVRIEKKDYELISYNK